MDIKSIISYTISVLSPLLRIIIIIIIVVVIKFQSQD